MVDGGVLEGLSGGVAGGALGGLLGHGVEGMVAVDARAFRRSVRHLGLDVALSTKLFWVLSVELDARVAVVLL